MIKNAYYRTVNFCKTFLKTCYKTSSDREKHIMLPLTVFISGVLPFAFIPLYKEKGVIPSEFGSLYMLLLLPLPGMIIFFHSLLSKSNILCISGLKAGMQALNYNLVMCVAVLSMALNRGSFDLSVIGSRPVKGMELVLEIPIILLYILNTALFDKNFIKEYADEYTGIGSLMLKAADAMIPLKEIVFFITLYAGGNNGPFGWDHSFSILVIKTAIGMTAFKLISLNIPKLRTDQIIEMIINHLMIFTLLWLLFKTFILRTPA